MHDVGHQITRFEWTPVRLLLLAVCLFLAWQVSHVAIVIFAGMVVGVLLDAAATATTRATGMPRALCLFLILLLLFALILTAVWWGGTTLWTQFYDLLRALRGLWEAGTNSLAKYTEFVPRQVIPTILPELSSILGGAGVAVSAVGTFVIIIALGAFFASYPQPYRTAVISLVPKGRRSQLSASLDHAGKALRRWLLGQGASMCVIFATTWAGLSIVGMPYSLALAILSGLLVFVPTLGPMVAGVIIVAAGLTVSGKLALYGGGIYLVIQTLESYLLTPFVQKEAVALPPAFTLGAQLVFGALFGLLGVAFAVPLAAVVKVMINDLYVEPQLGGGWSPDSG